MRLYPLFRLPVSEKRAQKLGRQGPVSLTDVWSIFWNLFSHSRIGHTSFSTRLKSAVGSLNCACPLKIFVFCFCRSSASDTGVEPLVVIKGNVIPE